MSTSAMVLMLVIAPLNSFLFASKSFSIPNNDQSASIQKENSGFVEGVEKDTEKSAVNSAPAPIPIFQPIKKETATNLAIPNAHSSLIIDVDTKKVLYESSGNERRQIASLTKMMTATLVMEKISNLDELVTIGEEEVYIEGTKVGCPRSGYCISQRLKVGEKISTLSLLKAMLMNSANDAALALGKHIGGSEEAFVDMMNRKAKELGLNDTNFCTPSGLEPDGRELECYSSAHDIAYIAANSIKYDLIWDIMRLPNNTVVTSADGTCSHTILNTDIVLNDITNCIGGKTGFTPLAGRSLLLGASDPTGKHRIIAVLLDDPYRWQDIKTMISWTFQSYEWR
ncbi:MAG: serine hydrolase [Parcubacteria group bacterium]|jgi:D-alanyl-D-alanine carboxypeptidase